MPDAAGPFIKWAGGKTQLLLELDKHVPSKFGRYYEPFLGGGSLYFWLANAGRIKRASLSDINGRLTDTYRVVRDNPSHLIRALARMKGAYISEKTREGKTRLFTAIRNEFNAGDALVRQAARLIFLNKTCFNGMFRENLSGEYNVPHGKFKSPPMICDEAGLLAASAALAIADISRREFDQITPKRGDFVYFDCPYWPASASSDFTAYSKEPFGPAQQEALRDFAMVLKKKGVHVLLSNADVPPVRKLYSSRMGFSIRRVEARRNVNSKADRRGKVGELIIW
jgi:DNA adenine methylase